MDQYDRNNIIGAFKKREIPIMVATDVAGRFYFTFIANLITQIFLYNISKH